MHLVGAFLAHGVEVCVNRRFDVAAQAFKQTMCINRIRNAACSVYVHHIRRNRKMRRLLRESLWFRGVFLFDDGNVNGPASGGLN
jgi:hypothetical protein